MHPECRRRHGSRLLSQAAVPRCRLGREGVAAGRGEFLVHGSQSVRSSAPILVPPSMLVSCVGMMHLARWAANWLKDQLTRL